MAASATFALKAGVWFRRGRLLIVSPDSQAIACLPSGRNSTYRPVQISETGSIAPKETKTRHQHLAVLPDWSAPLIDRYVDYYRPMFPDAEATNRLWL